MKQLPKLAIVVDAPNWAFDIGAKLIKKELEGYYNVILLYEKIDDKKISLFDILEEAKDCDIIHFLWRKKLLEFESKEFKQKLLDLNIDYDTYVKRAVNKISTGVYDHLFISEEEQKTYNKIFTKYSSGYFVCSERLRRIYKKIEGIPNPWGVIMDTVDGNKFVPQNLERFETSNINTRSLNIGWVGNSSWNINDGNAIDYKGFNTILKPVMEKLEKEYSIKGIYADRVNGLIPNDEMPKYYKNIDLFICVSLCEGTPRPILEAMRCGVPIITTDIGVVNEVLGEKQKEYILRTRTKEKLEEKIIKLYNNKSLLKDLSNENINMGKKQVSECRKKLYLEYFNYFAEMRGKHGEGINNSSGI